MPHTEHGIVTDVTSFARDGAHLLRRDVIARSSQRTARAAFFGVAALLFTGSVAAMVVWSGSMAAMGELPMPGGWTLSSAWMPMCGESWLQAAASFLGMWAVMMMAMMLPAVMPVLWRYRLAIGATRGQAADRLAALVGAGYFLVWMAFGAAIFPLGAALTALELREPELARTVPLAAGVIVVIAGLLQFTAWKAHHLACYREVPWHGPDLPADAASALRRGLRLGLHCAACSAGLTAMLLVAGLMDLRVMAIVTAAITVERLAPAGAQIARAIGAATIAAGLLLIARAAGL
jgi:predicted metal-binding membrane protein